MASPPSATASTTSSRRSYAPTPAKFLFAVLVMQGVLFLSAHYRWFGFNEQKGYTVLITVAATAVAFLVFVAIVLVSRLFKSKLQFSLATLLLMVAVMAIPSAWLARELQQARKRQAFLTEITSRGASIYYDGHKPGSTSVPHVPDGLVSLLGREFFGEVVTIQTGVPIDLDKLTEFRKLRIVTLYGDYVTDEGIAKLKRLPDLFMLGLNNTNITAAGLADLKNALPNCDIYVAPEVKPDAVLTPP